MIAHDTVLDYQNSPTLRIGKDKPKKYEGFHQLAILVRR